MPETNQLIISGMGELHLEVTIHKLQRDHGVQVTAGKPMVAYRQTLAKPIEFETRYIKQSGGRGKYAVINMRYEPLSKEMIEEVHSRSKKRAKAKSPIRTTSTSWTRSSAARCRASTFRPWSKVSASAA